MRLGYGSRHYKKDYTSSETLQTIYGDGRILFKTSHLVQAQIMILMRLMNVERTVKW